MTINIAIDRLHISLHGVSAQMIEAAAEGLEEELARRLGARKTGLGSSAAASAVDIAELSLSAARASAGLDAAGLRGLIADRLLDAIEAEQQSALSDAAGGL